MDEDEKQFQIALSFVDLIGPVIGRALVEYCGSARAVFKEKSHLIAKVPGMGRERVNALRSSQVWNRAEKELDFCLENDIDILFFNQEGFPRRLRRCPDSPTLLYCKGSCDLNPPYTVAVVGTRSETSYGRSATQKLIENWTPFQPLIISGLALGVDTTAHQQALENNLPTAAVLGHGLDRIYPRKNASLAKLIAEAGILISEFPSGTNPDAVNFPRRNRIVAGMSDATVVIEAAAKGGALITGQLAASYQRDVFALPGRINDAKSAGCLALIKNNEAHVLTQPQDVPDLLGWTNSGEEVNRQIEIPIDLSTEEAQIISQLSEGGLPVDVLSSKTGFPISQLFVLLTGLELRGLIRSRPGKKYELT